MVFALNALVWLKQPEYPWWPGVVLDPAALEMTTPAGYDTCVLCLPSASSSVAFANSENSEEILQFNPLSDAALIEEGKKDPQCAAAIEEALAVYEQQLQMCEEEEEDAKKKKKKLKHNELEKEHVGDETQTLVRTKKREKKRRESRERQESYPAKQHRSNQHHRGGRKRGRRHDDSDDEYDSHNLSSDDYDDRKRRRGHKTLSLRKTDQKESGTRSAFYHDDEDNVTYLERVFRKSRTAASDSELEDICRRLESLAAACAGPAGVVSVDRAMEEVLLDALSPLTLTNVTFDQLRSTKIGVVVGKFLSTDYPVRVVSLALGILTFWFRHLPHKIQESLIKQSSLESKAVGFGYQPNAV